VYEINRLAHDITGGIRATLPSSADFNHPEIGPLLHKYLAGAPEVSTEAKRRLIRLIESITGGTAAVEAMHGAGPPQAQRVMMLRDAGLAGKYELAKKVLDIDEITKK
jgi:4-hydroxybutyryl-CoA dehydratase/vinylacetyl-CoA-Delta-isomerase